jgi:TRAP-type C4-dicarboxylate transport system permease small subunit
MALSFLLPLGVSAQFSVGDSGLSQTGVAAKIDSNMNIAQFIGARVIQPVLGLLGLTFLCLMVYAGGLWMTAAGNDKRVAKAKDIMTGAVIGAVIIVAAYAVTSALFTALSTGGISGNPQGG